LRKARTRIPLQSPPKPERLLRITGLTLIVLVPTAVQPEVSYRTHFIGAGVGMLAALAYFRWKRTEIRAQEEIEEFPTDALLLDE
jgi:hypothetical protein